MTADRYIPKMGEHEARMIVLKILFYAKKGQLTASELKECFHNYREMGLADLEPVNNKGSPKFHHIVQNVVDRRGQNAGLYREIYSEMISPPMGQMIRITNDGRHFIRGYLNYVEVLKSAGFAEHTFFDDSPVDFLWKHIEAYLKHTNVKLTKDKLIKCIKSPKYASFQMHKLEDDGWFANLGKNISEQLAKTIASGNADISQVRPTAIDAWLHGRSDIDRHIDFIGFPLSAN